MLLELLGWGAFLVGAIGAIAIIGWLLFSPDPSDKSDE
jgi:hypothetical protein